MEWCTQKWYQWFHVRVEAHVWRLMLGKQKRQSETKCNTQKCLAYRNRSPCVAVDGNEVQYTRIGVHRDGVHGNRFEFATKRCRRGLLGRHVVRVMAVFVFYCIISWKPPPILKDFCWEALGEFAETTEYKPPLVANCPF